MDLRRIGRLAVVGLAAITLSYGVAWPALIVVAERGLGELSLWTVVIDVVALLGAAAAVVCLDRTFAAHGRLKLLWLGRTLGLIGATIAVSFPASLFNELVFSIGRGQSPAGWFPKAIDYEAATMELAAVPAIVALRWPRSGAALWVLSGLYGVFERVYQPFGVIFPDATRSGFFGVPILDALLQPAFIIAILLLAGSASKSALRAKATALAATPR